MPVRRMAPGSSPIQVNMAPRDVLSTAGAVAAEGQAVAVPHLDILKQNVLCRSIHMPSKPVRPRLDTEGVVRCVDDAVADVGVRRAVDVDSIAIWGVECSIARIPQVDPLYQDVIRKLKVQRPVSCPPDIEICEMDVLALNDVEHPWRAGAKVLAAVITDHNQSLRNIPGKIKLWLEVACVLTAA